MRFLIDRCAGRRLGEWLRQAGHDVIFGADLGPDPGDEILLEWASQHASILITIDTDFGSLVFTKNKPHRGIIRLPDVTVARRIALVASLLEDHAQDLEAGAIVTITGARIRVSHQIADAPTTDDKADTD